MSQTTLPIEREMKLVPADDAPESTSQGLALVIERLAANPAVDVAKLEKLIELQERILRHQAKAAFDDAFATMQGELPTIVEKGRTNNGTYATLEDIVEVVRPILTRHGFGISHETQWPGNGVVRIIAILTHRRGHEKRSVFESGADESGNKNDIQGLGSACSYGRRYSTLDVLNIVTRGLDNDGRGARPTNAPAAPKGFDAWWTDLQAVADTGSDSLKAAWAKSSPAFRDFLVKTNKGAWEALKQRAAEVKA